MSSRTRAYNIVLFFVAIALVVGLAYLYRPLAARDQQAALDDQIIIFDGACTIPQSQQPEVANGRVRLALSCDGKDNELRIFYVNATDIIGSNYIIDYPGSKLNAN